MTILHLPGNQLHRCLVFHTGNDVFEIYNFDSIRFRVYSDQNTDFLVPFYYPTLHFAIQKQN